MRVSSFLRLTLPPAYGLVVYLTLRLLQDTGSGSRFWRRPMMTNFIELVVSMLVSYIIILLVEKICRFNEKNWNQDKVSTIVKEILSLLLGTLILVNLIITPMAAFTDDGLSMHDLVFINVIPTLYMMIYYGVLRSRMLLKAYVVHQLVLERMAKDKIETELKFLKAQYHPHFLFNALNTIYFQMDESLPSAKQSIELLSELLRYQLYDGQQAVTLSQEFEYLKKFIAFQKMRSNKKLKLFLQIDKSTVSRNIYPLLLLPFVENAFKNVGGDYHIQISAQLKAGGFIFVVENSLAHNQNIANENAGLGLENLTRRLELLYPGNHCMTTTQKDNRFIAQFTLKLHDEK